MRRDIQKERAELQEEDRKNKEASKKAWARLEKLGINQKKSN